MGHDRSKRWQLTHVAVRFKAYLLAAITGESAHDVKSIGMEILRHRVILTYEAEAEGKTNDDVVQKVLDNVAVP